MDRDIKKQVVELCQDFADQILDLMGDIITDTEKKSYDAGHADGLEEARTEEGQPS